jgi:hypothetical protein
LRLESGNIGKAKRVHVAEATIQFTFTSLALAFACVAMKIGGTTQARIQKVGGG